MRVGASEAGARGGARENFCLYKPQKQTREAGLRGAKEPSCFAIIKSSSQDGAEGVVEVLGTTGSSFSTPIIIAAALADEQHTTKRPTPANIGIDIFVFYYYTMRFF